MVCTVEGNHTALRCGASTAALCPKVWRMPLVLGMLCKSPLQMEDVGLLHAESYSDDATLPSHICTVF